MTRTSPTLHMMCGKMAAGKSTLAAQLSQADGTVYLSEDVWLGALFSDQMTSPKDYVRCAAKLKDVMGPHVVSLLQAGVSVVLDFPANTAAARAWMRGLLDQTEADHQLHWLDTPDDLCLERLRARNAKGDHPFAPTEAQFHLFSKHFEPPHPDEGLQILRHSGSG